MCAFVTPICCCSVLQYVAVCCSVLQCVADLCVVSVLQGYEAALFYCLPRLQHFHVCLRDADLLLQCVAVYHSVSQCVAVCCSVLHIGAL